MRPGQHWRGFAKSLFKIGRGEWTVVAGTAGLAKKADDDPEKIPGALKDVGVAAYNDPLGTGQAIIGYDELAAGRWEDWTGQMGIGFLAGGGTATAASRGTRLPRIVGPARIQQLGPNAPVWGPAFAGRRLDFSKPDLNARPNSGSRVTVPPNAAALAGEYPTACATRAPAIRSSRRGRPAHRRARRDARRPRRGHARRRLHPARAGVRRPGRSGRRDGGRAGGGGRPVRLEIRDERPPVPAERLAQAEARLAEIGTRIPPSYKAFLAEQDGGNPVRKAFSFRQHDREQHDLVRLFGIAESPDGDLVSEADLARDRLPADSCRSRPTASTT